MKIWLSILIFSPFLGFLINALILRGRKKLSAFTGCLASLASFISALFLWGPSQKITFGNWITWGELSVDFSFLIDPLSLVMISVVTGASFLIHIFSAEYMANDKRISTYFSYLNLFLFNMLILVLADNLLLLFIGWEGVGLCSYLLIGFWFSQKEKAQAGMKAFIVNRIGDAAFLAALFIYFSLFGSLNFSAAEFESTSNPFLLTSLCLLMLMGASGKSAQIPLYVWLPSAMAGPTPVSALIHAATMVTAGVYLIIRTMDLWLLAPYALDVAAGIGALTALLGAYLACRAWDVKKILAYSTVSQLGYMFLALGAGTSAGALFHLSTHAFFKACLFLSAGSLIHALSGEQDIRNMGVSRKKLPYTFISFLIGALALMGFPFFSGFFSKDEILYHLFHEKHYILWLTGVIAAGLTSFYMIKTLYFIFWKPSDKDHKNIHEGGLLMNTPLLIFSFFSVAAGVINWPHFMPHFVPSLMLSQWLNANVPSSPNVLLEIILASGTSIFIFISGTLSFFLFYNNYSVKFPSWSLDNFYQKYFAQGTLNYSHSMFHHVETSLQTAIRSIRQYLLFLKKSFNEYQNGLTDIYALFMGAGLAVFLLVILFR